MKFWFHFLQTLPTAPFDELTPHDVPIEYSVKQSARPDAKPVLTAQSRPETARPQAPVVPTGLISGAVVAVGGFIFIIFLLLLSLWVYKLFYNITPNNEAFVRTGGLFQKRKKVIINGGCVVLPGFHELTRVPLREISIDVERTGQLAVRTQDYLRADMRVTFYVCINADEEDVSIAAARLSTKGRVSPEEITNALEKRADDAIRAAAKRKKLAEIDSDKLGFADEVLNLIQQDLKKVGLTLNNIAISEIEESDTYDENNFFDAQGVRLRTETIQSAIQQKREVELSTKVAIEQQELNAEKKSLTISKQQEEANIKQQQEIESLRLTQQQEIESLKAQRERETQEAKDKEAAKIERNKILQNQAIEEENIQQQLAIQNSQIEANITLEEQNKKFKVAQTTQQQEAEVAEITRQQTVDASRLRARIEVAAAEQESKVAQQEAAIAIANKEKERFAADAENAQAEEAVNTAKAVEEAERSRRLSIIDAEQKAQQKQIADQNVVEIDVFRRRRQAEIARQAAELEAESIRTLAEANRFQAIAEAEGKRALNDAENALSDANRTAEVIKSLFPQVAENLPEIVKSLAPQPGVLGDARIYAFPGAGSNGNGSNGMGDVNKLLLSTSGLSLINSLLEDGKLNELLALLKNLLNNGGTAQNGGGATEMTATPKPSPTMTNSPASEGSSDPQGTVASPMNVDIQTQESPPEN
ncbi:SPFH domain-containing protein [Spirulina sp. CS-785/01]|uniref:flotillin family protein n=1 Tax=Spirulina sp. CS-785/01 TaxID=3021716 RepID=UPI0023306359|nr:SPFH domain-containing protein [Spirulina sp. CS-785/01]MDB9312668.1 SPFH domain-containing protein [Spirulina sp. CS-785/01]